MTDGYLPTEYGRTHVARIRPRWEGEHGRLVRRWGERVFPGIPPLALVGFSVNSMGPTEDTGGVLLGGGRRQAFHEVGLYNTPAGPWPGPAPAHNDGNNWYRLHDSAAVRGMLGRNAVTEDGAWRTAIPDQVAVGLADYRDGGNQVAHNVRALGIAPTEGTLWRYILSAMAYVIGAGGTTTALRHYAPQLRGVPESQRFAALARAVAQDPAATHSAAHGVLRAWHRLASSEATARAVGEPTGWYATGLGSSQPAVEAGVLAAFRRPAAARHTGAPVLTSFPGPEPRSGGSGASTGAVVGWTVAALGAGAAGAYVAKRKGWL